MALSEAELRNMNIDITSLALTVKSNLFGLQQKFKNWDQLEQLQDQ